MKNNIKNIIEEEIDSLCSSFRKNPYLYFTENDITCDLYSRLRDRLDKCSQQDKTGRIHRLVHTEYATPFRCDMNGNNFCLKSDKDRTKSGGRFQRGHYDLVVLNPEFISDTEFDVIQGQCYKKMIGYMERNENVIFLYGVEIMYLRHPVKFSRGSDPEKGAKGIIQKIKQDTDKLEVLSNESCRMKNYKMLVFFREVNSEIKKYIEKELSNINILTVFEDRS